MDSKFIHEFHRLVPILQKEVPPYTVYMVEEQFSVNQEEGGAFF